MQHRETNSFFSTPRLEVYKNNKMYAYFAKYVPFKTILIPTKYIVHANAPFKPIVSFALQ